MILKADIMCSQRLNENSHLPWTAINLGGASVDWSHCTCMAALAESCLNIGALFLKLEATVKAGFTKKLALTLLACSTKNV